MARKYTLSQGSKNMIKRHRLSVKSKRSVTRKNEAGRIEKPWSFVEKVVYINLDDRKDRKREIERELSVFPKHKVTRLSAKTDTRNGHYGCSKSHIAALEMAIKHKWKNVLIMEDDGAWLNYETGYSLLENLASKPYDVITLGNVGTDYDANTYKLKEGQTATAYLVSKHYYPTLLKNFKEGFALLESTKDEAKYCLDQHWKVLQKKDNWFVIHPSLCVQRKSFSSICGEEVNYRSHFN
jgi:GR25 family glycosyltransferase involved in LPS biosynthesis